MEALPSLYAISGLAGSGTICGASSMLLLINRTGRVRHVREPYFAGVVDADGVRSTDALSRTLAATPDARRRGKNEKPLLFWKPTLSRGQCLRIPERPLVWSMGNRAYASSTSKFLAKGKHAETVLPGLRADPAGAPARADFFRYARAQHMSGIPTRTNCPTGRKTAK